MPAITTAIFGTTVRNAYPAAARGMISAGAG